MTKPKRTIPTDVPDDQQAQVHLVALQLELAATEHRRMQLDDLIGDATTSRRSRYPVAAHELTSEGSVVAAAEAVDLAQLLQEMTKVDQRRRVMALAVNRQRVIVEYARLCRRVLRGPRIRLS